MPTNDQHRGTGVPPVKASHGRDGHDTGVPPVKEHHQQDARSTRQEHGRDAHATGEIRIRQGAYLPHWTREGGVYSVAFRLADSLPQTVVRTWKREREEIERRAKQQGRPLSTAERQRLQLLFGEKVEKHLDSGHGACWMKRPEIADLVEEALWHFDGQRYALLAWCVMPNHVHVVFVPSSGHELDKLLHSWKSFTAHQAVKPLKISGPFWQPEYYDHLIRDDDDLIHAIEYVLNNPRAAGLEQWRWVGVNPELGTFLEGGTGVPPVKASHGRDGHATEIDNGND